MRIGFIGVGVMGKPMVLNLIKNEYNVSIYARNQAKVQDLINKGITCYNTIKEITRESDVIITMVGYPCDVEEVYFGKNNILENTKKGNILLDMTTSSPSLAKRIYEEAKKKEVYSFDCPVTGGDIGAKNATLTIFAAGDKEKFVAIEPILKVFGNNVCYCGEAGNGQHSKLANQIAIAGSLAATSELYAYAQRNKLDVNLLLPFWQSGSAGSFQMNNSFPKALQNNFEPGFYTKHFIKDMKLALDEASSKDLNLEMLKTVYEMFLKLEKQGYGEKGTQIITKYYEKN